MSKLTRDDVLKLAQLAKLDLNEDEIEKYRAEMSDILDIVEQLENTDIEGLEPTHQVTGLVNVTRPDEVRDYGYETDKLLENVPAVKDHQIKVKRILG